MNRLFFLILFSLGFICNASFSVDLSKIEVVPLKIFEDSETNVLVKVASNLLVTKDLVFVKSFYFELVLPKYAEEVLNSNKIWPFLDYALCYQAYPSNGGDLWYSAGNRRADLRSIGGFHKKNLVNNVFIEITFEITNDSKFQSIREKDFFLSFNVQLPRNRVDSGTNFYFINDSSKHSGKLSVLSGKLLRLETSLDKYRVVERNTGVGTTN